MIDTHWYSQKLDLKLVISYFGAAKLIMQSEILAGHLDKQSFWTMETYFLAS